MPRSEDLRLDSTRPSAIRGFLSGGIIKCVGTQPIEDGVSVTLSPGGGQFILHSSDYVVVAPGSNASMVLREVSRGNIGTLRLKYFAVGQSKTASKETKNSKKKKPNAECVAGLPLTRRRFPPPWTVEQTPGGFKVLDATGQT